MHNFEIKFTQYTNYAKKGAPRQRHEGTGVVSQPIHVTLASIEDAFEYAKTRLQGMRDADTVNEYRIASVVDAGLTRVTASVTGLSIFERKEVEGGDE